MDRKKFLRNVLGTAAAVTIGKYLPAPVPDVVWKAARKVGDLEYVSVFNIYFKTGYFRPGDILQTSDGMQWFVSQDKDGLIMETVCEDKIRRGRILESPEYDTNGCVKLCSTVPEYQQVAITNASINHE